MKYVCVSLTTHLGINLKYTKTELNLKIRNHKIILNVKEKIKVLISKGYSIQNFTIHGIQKKIFTVGNGYPKYGVIHTIKSIWHH